MVYALNLAVSGRRARDSGGPVCPYLKRCTLHSSLLEAASDQSEVNTFLSRLNGQALLA